MFLLLTSLKVHSAGLPAEAGRFFQLTNRWTSLSATVQPGVQQLGHAEVGTRDLASHWTAERVGGSEWFRLKNRLTNGYMHIETRSGVVSVGNVPEGFWSSQWRIEDAGEFVRLKNRWVPNDAMHVEDVTPYIQHGPSPDGWWSAQWRVANVEGDIAPASVIGQWSEVVDWPLIAIHSVLASDGKVLTYGTDAAGTQGAQFIYDVWDPALGTQADAHATLPNGTGTDLFCSAQIVLPDSGDVLITGGDTRGLNTGRVNTGVVDTNLFRSENNTLIPNTRMNYARWYPTATVLANGEILVHGGIDENGAPVTTPEIFNPRENTWRLLRGANNDFYTRNTAWWYPKSWLAPNGTVFGIAGGSIYTIDPQGQGRFDVLANVSGSNRYITATSVMFRPGRILQIAGGTRATTSSAENASNQVTEYNINGAVPVALQRPALTYPRHWGNATVLPDGKVVVTGGSAAANTLKGVATAAEIYDPDTSTWTVGARAREDRLYHSTAILLPDASILTAGGGAPGPADQNGNIQPGNLNAEIYYPPYYFNDDGSRKVLSTLSTYPNQVQYGNRFDIETENATRVDRVTLVRTGSNTHSKDMGQRFMELRFTRTTANTLSVRAPDRNTVAPPGYYLLFVIDEFGTPSQGAMISLQPEAVGGNTEYVRLSDRWTNRELLASQTDTVLRHADTALSNPASHWLIEPLEHGSEWFRLKNRISGHYMHIESLSGTVSVGDVPEGFWSSQWRTERIGGYSRLVNRWRPNERIHVEQLSGVASHGVIDAGAWSSQWRIEDL